MTDKERLMIEFCKQQSQLSKCKDKKTAAILIDKDMQQIFSIGINGGPKHGTDCLCDESYAGEKAKYSCIHAEMNCLVKNVTINNIPKVMICTKQPCTICASLIVNVNTNIIEVWYEEPYWDKRGIQILEAANIIVRRINNEDKIYTF